DRLEVADPTWMELLAQHPDEVDVPALEIAVEAGLGTKPMEHTQPRFGGCDHRLRIGGVGTRRGGHLCARRLPAEYGARSPEPPRTSLNAPAVKEMLGTWFPGTGRG